MVPQLTRKMVLQLEGCFLQLTRRMVLQLTRRRSSYCPCYRQVGEKIHRHQHASISEEKSPWYSLFIHRPCLRVSFVSLQKAVESSCISSYFCWENPRVEGSGRGGGQADQGQNNEMCRHAPSVRSLL